MTATAPPRPRARAEVQAPISWRRSLMSGAWWSAPHVLAPMIWVSLVIFVGNLSPATFRTYWKTTKFIDDEYVKLFVYAALAFTLAALTLTQVIRSSSRRKLRGSWLLEARFRRVVFGLYSLGLVASVGFAVVRLGGPVTFLSQAFTVVTGGGGSADMRRAFDPVSGLTSLTQLGVLLILVEGINLMWVRPPDRSTSRRRILIVLTYGVVRSVLASERLAIVELLLPLLVVWARARPLRSARQAMLMAIAPFMAVGLLFLGFAGTEYFRSYQSYKLRIDDSLLEFSRNRLIGYYATSLNNSALYMEYDTPKAPFNLLLSGVLDWPRVRETLEVADPKKQNVQSLLSRYANPEFTNRAPTGVLHLEGGFVYVILFVAAYGAVAGLAYAGYRFGSVGGTVWFGLVFTSIVEFPRIWYLSGPRMSAVMVVALVGWLRYQRMRA